MMENENKSGYFISNLISRITKTNKFQPIEKETIHLPEALTDEEVKEIIVGKKPKTTEAGYINKNNQKNYGRSDERGTDHGQWFYHMECLDCGNKYLANGTDIWQRKCPKCQGGRP